MRWMRHNPRPDPGRFARCTVWVFAAILSISTLPLAGFATPELNRAKLLYQSGLRIKPNSWATFSYSITNPDDTAVEVTVMIKPAGQRNVTIYSQTQSVEARSIQAFSVPVVVGTVDEYRAELYVDGKLVVTKPVIFAMIAADEARLMFFNDDADLATGWFELNGNMRVRGGYLTPSRVGAHQAASHWIDYEDASMLVIMRPDVDLLSSRQLRTVMEYTARGGTTLFADPKGTMAMSRTILAEMLPVTPIRVRKLDSLTDYSALGIPDIEWSADTDFLESYPRGDGLTVLTHEGFPLIRWRRYGLGYVVVSAVNPSDGVIMETRNFGDLYEYFLAAADRLTTVSREARMEIRHTLDALTGIPIPGPALIRMIIMLYLAVVAAVFFWGVAARRRSQSWLLLMSIAACFTVTMLFLARLKYSGTGGRRTTVLDFRTIGPGFRGGEQIISVFSPRAAMIDVIPESVDVRLALYDFTRRSTIRAGNRPILSPKKPEPGEKKRKNVAGSKWRPFKSDLGHDQIRRDPVTISVEDGAQFFRELRVKSTTSMPYTAAISGDDAASILSDLPVVTWLKGGPRIPSWQCPLDLDIRQAFLICEAGYLPLKVDGRGISLSPESAGMQIIGTSKEWATVVDVLSKMEIAAPSVLLISDTVADMDDRAVTEGGSQVWRTISLLPIRQDYTAETVALPFERIAFTQEAEEADVLKDARGRWQRMIENNDARTFVFDARLPVGTSLIKVETITWEFMAENRGQNLAFSFQLMPLPTAGGLPAVDVPMTADGLYEVSGLPDTGYINPLTGRFRIQLTVTPREPVPLSSVQDEVFEDENSWWIREFRIAVDGTLPAISRGVF